MDQGTTAAAANDESLQLPSIFLSHSGKQKAGFVTHLYHALRHANHRPFFDKDYIDSLPPGLEYPSRIFQACKASKMGVIVLSEDYVTNLWPMLELQHLLLPSCSPDVRRIYPLFYGLRPSDLATPANLRRWEECWAKEAEAAKWHSRMTELQRFMSSSGCDIQINLDLSSWSEMLKKLQYRSGEVHFIHDANNVRTLYQSDHDFIQAVVSNVCVSLPPPRKFSLGDGIQGVERIEKEIAEAFMQEESLGADGVRAIGVHGIGGSGKTTLCKMMTNFFSNEFCGRCLFIQFPSNNSDVQSLLQNIKAILGPRPSVGASTTHDVTDLDEAMGLLEEDLRREKQFLAIDNVWDNLESELQNGLDYAKRIMQMKLLAGSKILVTSRSRKVLACLLRSRLVMNIRVGNLTSGDECSLPPAQPYRIINVPSLTEAEAVEALKFYSCFSGFIPKGHLQRLAQSCFFQGQCHPLYLKLKGAELERKGSASFNGHKWKETISCMVSDGDNPGDSIKKAVSRVVERSLDILPSHLQHLFINLVSWSHVFKDATCYGSGHLDYLRFHCNDGTTLIPQVLALEYHGLLEIKLDDASGSFKLDDPTGPLEFEIHDLHVLAAMSKAESLSQVNALATHVVASNRLSGFSSSELASKKHVLGGFVGVSTLGTLFGSRKAFGSWLGTTLGTWLAVAPATPAVQVQIQVLRLWECSGSVLWPCRSLNFGGGSMETLRALSLNKISEIREINGWEGVPHLMYLELSDLRSLQRIKPLGCLKRLEMLHLRECASLEVHAVVGAAVHKRRSSLVKVGDCLPKLQVLEIESNNHLVEVGLMLPDTFPSLKRLQLSSCRKLERFLDLQLGSLRTLRLDGCTTLRSMEGSMCSLTGLQELDLEGCRKLESIPDLRNLANLRTLVTRKSSVREIRLSMTAACDHLRKLSLNVLRGKSSSTDESSSSNFQTAACDYLRNLRLNNILRGESSSTNESSSSTSVSLLLRDALLLCNNDYPEVTRQPISGNRMNPFVNLRSLRIHGCSDIIYWLDVSGLQSLQKLVLASFESLQKLTLPPDSVVNLEILKVRRCLNLEEISGLGRDWHTRLKIITIKFCPKLVRIPGLHALRASWISMALWYCDNFFVNGSSADAVGDPALSFDSLEYSAVDRSSPSFYALNLLGDCCSTLLTRGVFPALTSLTRLVIANCYALTDVSALAALTSLQRLSFYNCTALIDVSALAALTSLKRLTIDACTALRDVSALAALTSLRRLTISDCTALTIDESVLAALTSLERLTIRGAPRHCGLRCIDKHVCLGSCDILQVAMGGICRA